MLSELLKMIKNRLCDKCGIDKNDLIDVVIIVPANFNYKQG